MKKFFHLLKDWFSNDKFLLVFSFLLAIIMWMMVISDRNPQTNSLVKNVPVEFVNAETLQNSGLHIISKSNDEVYVSISGRLSEIYHITAKDIDAKLDLSSVRSPGVYHIPVIASVDKAGVSLEEVIPETISIEVDYIVKNRRDIEVLYQGELQEGYELESATLSIDALTLEGPETTLRKIAKAVAVVDLSNITESGDVDCKLKLANSSMEEITDANVTMSSTSVTVSLKVNKVKQVPVQVVLDGEVDAHRMSVLPIPKTVIIKGEKDIIDKIEKIETEPVKKENIPTSSGKISGKLAVPENVTTEKDEIGIEFILE